MKIDERVNLKQHESAYRTFLFGDNHRKGCELEAVIGMFENGAMSKETFIAILYNFAAVMK